MASSIIRPASATSPRWRASVASTSRSLREAALQMAFAASCFTRASSRPRACLSGPSAAAYCPVAISTPTSNSRALACCIRLPTVPGSAWARRSSRVACIAYCLNASANSPWRSARPPIHECASASLESSSKLPGSDAIILSRVASSARKLARAVEYSPRASLRAARLCWPYASSLCHSGRGLSAPEEHLPVFRMPRRQCGRAAVGLRKDRGGIGIAGLCHPDLADLCQGFRVARQRGVVEVAGAKRGKIGRLLVEDRLKHVEPARSLKLPVQVTKHEGEKVLRTGAFFNSPAAFQGGRSLGTDCAHRLPRADDRAGH